MDVLKNGFPVFLRELINAKDADYMKKEYLLPNIADDMLKDGIHFTVLQSSDHWFGVTYKEDKLTVMKSFRKLYETGVYKNELYSDL